MTTTVTRTAVRVAGLTKVYGAGDARVVALDGRRRRVHARSIHRDHGTVGLSSADVLAFLRRSVDELGQTVIMVTHDPAAARYGDDVITFADGRVVP